jgi:DNA invertase Pin-like site-specific DNA recombinase
VANQEKYTILYARLSDEDARAGDSLSIENQRRILEKYAADNGFENIVFKYDDGYTGANYNRPAWREIIELIEADAVANLIVKDLSRLGREYLQTGQYQEIIFPNYGVRLIAPGDNYDSKYPSANDYSPIKNWFNEMYCRETSKKVRDVLRSKAERGERLGNRPPYGYKVDEDNHRRIVPDEETAPIVQRIFALCASGKGPTQIANILKAEKILTPTNYYYRQHGKGHRFLDTERPYRWSGTTVSQTLSGKCYLGHTVGLRKSTLSYKNKKVVYHDESEQILVENTHEPLITQEVWDIVQSVRQRKKRTVKQKETPSLFSGIAFCQDCGASMITVRCNANYNERTHLVCYSYNKFGKEECSPHRIHEDDLIAIVLDDIRRITHFARQKEKLFTDYINRKNSAELRRDITAAQKELDSMKRRNAEIMKLIKKLFEANVLGSVTNEQFRMLSNDYTAEQKELQSAIPLKEETLEKLKASAANTDAFIEKAKRYTEINELTPELLHLFVSRIEIGFRAKYDRNAPQEVRIIYRDVGVLDGYEGCDLEPPEPIVPEWKTA